MARPKKETLDYFPFDTDFFYDAKIRRLKAKYGAEGIVVYQYILCSIYHTRGYYMEYSDDIIFDISEYFGTDEKTIMEMIDFMVLKSLLVIKEHEDGKVITSCSVQRRYQEAKKSISRKSKVTYTVDRNIWLLSEKDTSDEIVIASAEGLPAVNGGLSAVNEGLPAVYAANKSKVNESKVNEIKAKESKVSESKSDETIAKESKVSESKSDETTAEVSKVSESKTNGTIQHQPEPVHHNTHLQIPCKDGVFSLDEHYYTELTRTYPEMCIDESLKKMCAFLTENPEKQRRKSAIASYMMMWLERDNSNGKYRLSKPPISAEYTSQYSMADDIAEYESHSVVDYV